jgi:hypothetical protein
MDPKPMNMIFTISVICQLWNVAAAWSTLALNNSRLPQTILYSSQEWNISKDKCLDMNAIVEDDICLRVIGQSIRKMEMIQDFVAEQIPNLVEVRQSTVTGAGMGLFVKETIPAGTLVAFYPAHVVGINLGETTRRITLDKSGKSMEQHTWEENALSGLDYIQYVIGNRPILSNHIAKDLGVDSIFLDVDIKRKSIPLWNAHMINDGAIVLSNTEDGVLKYYQDSRVAKNCVTIPFGPSPLLATITSKNLRRGEELFTTYGCSYWLESLIKQTGEMEETCMSDSIVYESKNVALDIFNIMKAATLKYKHQVLELESFFNVND